ncbi:MAG TPA: peptidylprolyl isomerase [Coleofasciculaceae cyanobacterium]|jgi:parvulin-like peptidyl-prolyl isomerase
MTSESFLTIDEQPISMGQVFRYLQANGKLDGFIGDIVRQFVMERELQSQSHLSIGSAVVEQAVIDFRLQNQLTDPKQFQDWLASNGLTYEAFHSQLGMNFRMKSLKDKVTEARLPEYFIERKVYLDRVVVSRIIVNEKELADELKSQLQEGASFDQLAKEYSITDDRIMNGMVGPVSRGTMPDMLRAAVDMANPGEIVGPLGLDDRWGLFRIEAFLPASLDDPQVRQALQDELFEHWLAEKMQSIPIKLQVD